MNILEAVSTVLGAIFAICAIFGGAIKFGRDRQRIEDRLTRQDEHLDAQDRKLDALTAAVRSIHQNSASQQQNPWFPTFFNR